MAYGQVSSMHIVSPGPTLVFCHLSMETLTAFLGGKLGSIHFNWSGHGCFAWGDHPSGLVDGLVSVLEFFFQTQQLTSCPGGGIMDIIFFHVISPS